MTTTKYNKSEIMKLANHYVKQNGYSRSIALKLAWVEAKRNEFYKIIVIIEPVTPKSDMSSMANTLIDYYSNYTYNGD